MRVRSFPTATLSRPRAFGLRQGHISPPGSHDPDPDSHIHLRPLSRDQCSPSLLTPPPPIDLKFSDPHASLT